MPTANHITIPSPPAYLPASAAARLAKAGKIIFRFSRSERKIYRKRKAVPVSEWCERHRVVTMSSLPGKWKNEVTPYLAGIMNASFFPSVRETVLCKSPQSGGSEAVNNCIAYAADRAPGPCLYVYPDELTARENCQDRITPMFSLSPRLRTLQSGRDDDAGALKLKLLSMPIYMAWARSVSRLANKPCRYVVFDETDKYQGSNQAETDPIRLGEARVTTFRWTSKVWKISSPSVESGYIWQAMLAAQVIFEYVVKCPSCHGEQVMHFGEKDSPGGIKWPADRREADDIEINDLAWYQCEHCQAQWHDFQRDQGVRAGFWRAKHDNRKLFDYLAQERPRKIAFHVPAWISTFVGISKIAAAYRRCKLPGGAINLNAYKDFCNTIKAEPWLQVQQVRQSDKILALRDDRPRGMVPGGNRVACLLGTADTQDNGFYYQVRAWGYGPAQESWLVREGFIDSLENLASILWGTIYYDPAGNKYLVKASFIDAMGHRTKEVYDFCRRNRRRIMPIKGEQRMNAPFAYTKLEFYPGTQEKIPGGIKLCRLNTNYYKDHLDSKLGISPGDPGGYHFHADFSEEWASMMCAEFVNDQGVWECQKSKANHAWDLATYDMALADILEIQFWTKPEIEKKEDGRKTSTTNADDKTENYVRPDWLNR